MPPLPRSLRAVPLALAVLAAGGCYARHAGGWTEPAPVYIDVYNHNSLDINVYTVHSGMRMRLGTVVAATAGHFKAASREFADGSMQLYAAPIGANRGYLSETIYVQPGVVVTWTLEQSLPQSSLVVRDTTS